LPKKNVKSGVEHEKKLDEQNYEEQLFVCSLRYHRGTWWMNQQAKIQAHCLPWLRAKLYFCVRQKLDEFDPFDRPVFVVANNFQPLLRSFVHLLIIRARRLHGTTVAYKGR
jgi:hypothetical protein